MVRRREVGYAVAFVRSGDGYSFSADDYEAVRAAWTQGLAFVDAHTVQGDPMTLKLAAVECVQRYSPEGIAAGRAEDAADAAEDAVPDWQAP